MDAPATRAIDLEASDREWCKRMSEIDILERARNLEAKEAILEGRDPGSGFSGEGMFRDPYFHDRFVALVELRHSKNLNKEREVYLRNLLENGPSEGVGGLFK